MEITNLFFLNCWNYLKLSMHIFTHKLISIVVWWTGIFIDVEPKSWSSLTLTKVNPTFCDWKYAFSCNKTGCYHQILVWRCGLHPPRPPSMCGWSDDLCSRVVCSNKTLLNWQNPKETHVFLWKKWHRGTMYSGICEHIINLSFFPLHCSSAS